MSDYYSLQRDYDNSRQSERSAKRRAEQAEADRDAAVEALRELATLVECQQMMTVEDCNVSVARHVKHPDRYEKLPRSEWCPRCEALALLAEQEKEQR